jgi:geranylgeranyl diphosphate synthase type II
MLHLPIFQKIIEEKIQKLSFGSEPSDLYDPIRYMLRLGGKRIRPALVLLSCDLFEGNYEDALSAALGIEVFHNFTLLHDDIMDKAPLRRSMPTVHTKWNSNIAILSGDAMFVKSCQLMMHVNGNVLPAVMDHFLESALLVCEGQQWDMTFQQSDDVSISQYLKMIELKTAALLACALKTGALIAETGSENCSLIHGFGKNLGIAFQLHDDLLDVYGDEEKFGKQCGGDIIENKRTFLLLKAFELASLSQEKELRHWISLTAFNGKEKVGAIKNIFQSLGVKEKAEEEMESFFAKATDALALINADEEKKRELFVFADALMQRQH